MACNRCSDRSNCRKHAEEDLTLGIAGDFAGSNGLERGLEVLGVEHPSFKEYGIALPTKAVIWLESLNGRSDFANALQQNLDFAADPDAYMARRENKPQLPVVTRKAGDPRSRYR